MPRGRAVPHNVEAEESLLGAMMLTRDAVDDGLRELEAGDFYVPRHRVLFAAIEEMVLHGEPIDPVTLSEYLRAHDQLEDVGGKGEILRIQAQTPASANSTRYAAIVAETSARRSLIEAGGNIVELGYGDLDIPTAIARSHDLVKRADFRGGGAPDPNVVDWLAEVVEERWVVPGLLQEGERLIIVAGEKYGKSSLLRQWAVCCSAGLHPYRFHSMRALRVLLVDLENPVGLARKKIRPMVDHLLAKLDFKGGAPYDPEMLRPICKPGGIDVGDRADRNWFFDRIEANAQAMGGVDLICLGPIYKMDPEADFKFEGARRVQDVLDTVRERYNCALLLEAHAPQESFGAKTQARSLRPAGSRKWLAWPEFCRALEPAEGFPGCADHYDVFGARDEREWPTLLRRGGDPWLWAEEGWGA